MPWPYVCVWANGVGVGRGGDAQVGPETSSPAVTQENMSTSPFFNRRWRDNVTLLQFAPTPWSDGEIYLRKALRNRGTDSVHPLSMRVSLKHKNGC